MRDGARRRRRCAAPSRCTPPTCCRRDDNEYSGMNYFDYGPQLSRSWRALKVWMTLRYYGAEGIRTFFRQTMACAKHLHQLVQASDDFEVVQPAPLLYIYAFRWAPQELRGNDAMLDELNQQISRRTAAPADRLRDDDPDSWPGDAATVGLFAPDDDRRHRRDVRGDADDRRRAERTGESRRAKRARRARRAAGLSSLSLRSSLSRLPWPGAESNCRHRDFQSRALPTELPGRKRAQSLRASSRRCHSVA